MNDEKLGILLQLYADGYLEIAKLVDLENKKYDIAVLMARVPVPTVVNLTSWEYKFVEYIYGGESYTEDTAVITDIYSMNPKIFDKISEFLQ